MKKKALALILSLTMLVSSVVPGLLVSANGTTTSDITTIEEVETPLSSGEDETQPPEGGSTTNPTNPGEGGTEGGTTNPGEGGTEGGTTNPGEGGAEGGTTNPGEGGTEGGTTNPGEGGTEGGTTNPGEGGTEGGTTNPGEGEGGETDISAEELYNRFMACTTIEEIETLKAQVSEEDWAKLTDDQKAKIEEYIANLKGEGETDVSAEELYNRFMACKTIEEIEALKAQLTEEDWAKLSEEQKKTIEEYIETLKAQTETAKFEGRYNRIMSAQTSAEVEAIIKEFADEAELEAFMKWMQDNGKLEALQQHLSDVYASEYEAPVTVSVTNAGPLLPPIYVGGMQRAFSATPFSDTDKNGLDLSKTVRANKDGTYTITLEAFTTGTVTTEQKDVPLDIVLVLDQSGSMNDSFGNTNRQAAMKTAVNNFIDSVGEKYSPSTGANHRIALVEFRSDATILKGWTDADSDGVTELQNTVSRLKENGATNVGAGMQEAASLINDSSYTGPYTKRQRVVIVFTDGVPTTSSDFNIGVANEAISVAKAMKDQGVTVYSIGIFDGANPEELYGKEWTYSTHDPIPCTGDPNSYWGGSLVSDISGKNDFAVVDIAAGNRFLNYLSSKYKSADQIGVERGWYNPIDWWGLAGYGIGYKITENFTPTTSDNYYLTASDESGLNEIFQSISDQISNPSISLGTTATVKDVISPYFTVPSEGDVKVYTEDAVSGGFSGTKVPFEARIEVKDGTISVSNFDFDKNFVTPDPRESEDGTANFYGRKLIVEITTSPKQGFLGGNNVPTNGEKSGLYITKDGQEKMVEEFAIPHTDVAIPTINKVDAKEQNVYLMQGLTADQLKEGVTVTLNGRKPGDDAITLDLSKENYGLADWQTEFVTIDVELTDKDGSTVTPDNLTEDQTYNVKVTISPKQPATEGEGVPSQNKTGEVQINVFKPEITWKDSQIDLGDTPNYQEQNFEKVEWKHQPKEGDPDLAPGSMGTAPTLTYTFDPEAAAFQQETNVKVTGVKVGETNVPEEKLSDCITFLHDDAACDFPGCKWEEAKEKSYHFIVHIKSFDLTITKTVEGEVLDNQTFVFTVQRNDSTDAPIEVVIKGANSKTIKGLPSGTYTVTEKTDWSWRYNAEGGNQQTVTPGGATAKVTFNNTLKSEQKWLNGYAYQPNDFVTAAKNLVNTLLSVIK